MAFKQIFTAVNLIIVAGLLLVACNSSPSKVTSSASEAAVTTATPALTFTATSPPKTPEVSLTPAQTWPSETIDTVFVIVMENTNWSEIQGSNSAPYLNNVLLPEASYAEAYYNPPGLHPSEPNYLWLEAGTNFGITDDKDPDANHQNTSMHLVTLLDQIGVSWKSYQEDISGTDCPLTATGLYAPKHNPMVYFDDVTDTNNPDSPYCIAHVRPVSELATDLQSNSVAQYNFIVPNLCHDMHSELRCLLSNRIQNGDDWLANNVPHILDSPAYAKGGVLFITWDEGSGNSDGPIGLLVLSPKAKGGGYSNTIHYTHSSLLRTIQ